MAFLANKEPASSRYLEGLIAAASTNYVYKFLAFIDHLPPSLTLSTLQMLTRRSQHFWTTYPPLVLNVVCE